MSKIISFMHVSLDGFVAGPNGELNWVNLNQEIFDHVEKRISQGNAALYGRVTYELMEGYWPTAADKPNASSHDINHSTWYKNAHKIVLSKTMQGMDNPNTSIISDNLADSLRSIKQMRGENNKEILLFGSPSATHALMQEDLIDGYWLFVNPVILGQGIPLFANIKDKVKLTLLNTKPFDCGVIELNYWVDRG